MNWFIWFVSFIWLVWFNQTNETNQTNHITVFSGWRGLVRQERHVFLFKGEMDDQEDDPHADCRVGDIEGRPMVRVHIDIEKVDDLAIP